MADSPITIELPVCPQCGHVSKIPAGLFSGKSFCSGPKVEPHKRVKMIDRRFVEARETVGGEA